MCHSNLPCSSTQTLHHYEGVEPKGAVLENQGGKGSGGGGNAKKKGWFGGRGGSLHRGLKGIASTSARQQLSVMQDRR